MATNLNKKGLTVTIERRNTDDSVSGETKTPRTARFAEATSVYSPIDAPRSPFSGSGYPTNHFKPQPQVSDVGFGYVQSVEMEDQEAKYLPQHQAACSRAHSNRLALLHGHLVAGPA
jgi:hypothetical protein